MTDARTAVREFLTRTLRRPDLRDDDDIFARGFVTSLFAMQLVMFVERTFGIAVETDDLDVAHFSSVAAIEQFVRRKRSGAAAMVQP